MPTLQMATPDFLDNAPFRIELSVTVMAPIEACWDLLADQASWPQWFDGMTSVAATPWIWTTSGEERVVTVGPLTIEERCISFDAQREYAFAIIKWPLPTAKRAAEGVRLDDMTNGASPRTRLTYIGAFESTAIGKRLERVLTKQLSATWKTALTELGVQAAARAAAKTAASSTPVSATPVRGSN